MSKSEGAAIKRLILDLGGDEVSLTIEQAKKLFKALDEMFGTPDKVVEHIYDHGYPWRWSNPTPHVWMSADNSVRASYDGSNSTLLCSLK